MIRAKIVTGAALVAAVMTAVAGTPQSREKGSIRGMVGDIDSGIPLAGANVAVVGSNLGAATNRDGEFAILNVPDGVYVIRVTLAGYESMRWENIRVRDGRDVYVMLRLKRGPSEEPVMHRGDARHRTPVPDDSAYFVSVETMPEPVGGLPELMRRVRYPEVAREGGLQGTVFLDVFIDETGVVEKVVVVKSVHESLDRAAVDALKATRFTPGMHRERAVKTRIGIPIRFRLEKDAKKP